MATPTRKPHGLPLDAFLPTDPFDEADANEIHERRSRNREYLFSRWDELLRLHPGQWAAVYCGDQLLIGDDAMELRRRIPSDDERREAFIWQLGDPPGVVSIPG